jgi:outer membrane protein, multidrug efflux system
MKKYLLFLLVLIFSGCAVGPKYHRPDLPAPEEWQNSDTTVVLDSSTAAIADTAWWQLFGDTVMTSLIETALQENNDIRVAASQVEELLGLYRVARSDFFPKIGAEGTGLRGQFGVPGDADQERSTHNYFNVNLSAGWEIDLWGKLRRANEAARADLLASEEYRRGVVLTISTLVANAYIDLLSFDQQLHIARMTVSSRERSLQLFHQRLEKGDASQLEISQIESEYWQARAQVPLLEKNITQLQNILSVLLGRNPGNIPRGGAIDSLQLPMVPDGLPSEILNRRPDVRLAEEQLIAANARIGVAKSLYFPSLSLTGLFGTASGDLENLFTPNAAIWNVGGQVLQPIFRGGEIRGQVKAAEGVQKQALYAYVQAVQSAFKDVENSLVERSRVQEQLDALGKRVKALQIYTQLANMRYLEGLTDYLEVLDAERALFSSQLQYTEIQAGLYKSVVGIYSALAGGWVDWAASVSYLPEDPVEPREIKE